MSHLYSFIILVFSLFCLTPAIAQEEQPEPPPLRVQSEWVVPSRRPPSNYILFLIDGSGSMTQDKISVAINFALEIAGAPVDDLQIAVSTFGSSTQRWPGTEDPNPNTGEPMSLPGWSVMPSPRNLSLARDWLSNHLDSGSTYLIPGINHCFSSCDGQNGSPRIENLTIIILTDGDFTDSMDPRGQNGGILAAVAHHQKARTDNNLPEAIIGVIGISASGGGRANLQRLAGELGFLSLTFSRDDEEE